MIVVPMRTVSALNARETWAARHRRVKGEKEAVLWMLKGHAKPEPPLLVTLTRVAPSNGLDPFENLPSALKGVVDALAVWLGVNDRRSDIVRYECKQRRGPWAVEIEWQPMVAKSD